MKSQPSCAGCVCKTAWAPRALEFAILTGARSGEVRGAVWGEIDPTTPLWVVPLSVHGEGVEHLHQAAARFVVGLAQRELEQRAVQAAFTLHAGKNTFWVAGEASGAHFIHSAPRRGELLNQGARTQMHGVLAACNEVRLGRAMTRAVTSARQPLTIASVGQYTK